MCPDAVSSRQVDRVALRELREDHLTVVELGVGIVGALDVRAEEAGELDRPTGRLERRGRPVARRAQPRA